MEATVKFYLAVFRQVSDPKYSILLFYRVTIKFRACNYFFKKKKSFYKWKVKKNFFYYCKVKKNFFLLLQSKKNNKYNYKYTINENK